MCAIIDICDFCRKNEKKRFQFWKSGNILLKISWKESSIKILFRMKPDKSKGNCFIFSLEFNYFTYEKSIGMELHTQRTYTRFKKNSFLINLLAFNKKLIGILEEINHDLEIFRTPAPPSPTLIPFNIKSLIPT